MDMEKVIEAFDDAKELVWLDDDEYTVGYNDGIEAGKNITLAMLKEQDAVRPQDAEMLIIHNGGAEEYVEDIESIVLLSHKDYDIVYCGRFSEGR